VNNSNDLTRTPNPEARERLKQLVIDSVPAAESKRAYARAIDNFFDWFQAKRPSTGFSKATVQSYRSVLIESGLSSSTISLNLTAIRRLAAEACDNGLMASELAAGVGRVKGVKRIGLRIGTWLTISQAETLMLTPSASTLKGKRDRALISILIGCGLRREEVASLEFRHVQHREGRWVLLDLTGKGGRVRSIPMPMFAKTAIDVWTQAASITTGRIFRSINKSGKLSGSRMTGQAVFETVKKYTADIGMEGVSPHNLRRTFARLSHKGKSSLEQIQLSMGHMQISTTSVYIGFQQTLDDGPCDHLGIRLPDSTS
jgi:site-specific recombinase XerD